jgi:ribosomal protein S18 acetylase RimI-like enzyme
VNLRDDSAEPAAAPRYRLVELDGSELDRLEPLWNAMVSHHRGVVADAWPIRDDAEAWRRRRAQYAAWLESGTGRAFVAVPGDDPAGPLAGYAMVVVVPSGPTWDVGDVIGELESLAVAPGARGEGVGTMLIDGARARLREQGISHWSVGVVEANDAATRLYLRQGFRPFYRQLLAPTTDPRG